MPIDTSSYYPEVPGEENGYSLNNRDGGLFDAPALSESPQKVEEEGEVSELPPVPEEKIPSEPETPAEKSISVISHILSWGLSPLLMPVYGLLLAFGLSILQLTPMRLRLSIVLVVAAVNVVLPMLLIFLLKVFGFVTDLGLNNRRERPIPYILMILCYLGSAWFLHAKGAPDWLWLFFVGGATAAFINMVINFKWKISAHAAGIAGLVALILRIQRQGWIEPTLFFWLILVIILAGLMGSARVWLGRHTVWQVLAGYAVGFCSVFFISGL